MKDLKWFFNRLKAMKPKEMIWRVQQKRLQRREYNNLYTIHKPVIDIPLPQNISNIRINIEKLSINWDNRDWTEFSSLDLFNVYDYKSYKKEWNAGFQTENHWPEDKFSSTISISQRIDIGDIRTNWELNRHFQFAALAKSYYCTKEKKYISELRDLFYDWNQHNLFLHGVEWTSAMELAIRVNSWIYAYAFLKKAECENGLLDDIEHGIFVMTDYILKHRAKFSSANNHLIVEMYAVALVGIVADFKPWCEEAISILTEELTRQNYEDGVNKEMSLHYQSFIMEAYGLLWLVMLKNNIDIPEIWKKYLTAMSEFVADSTDDYGSTIEFGDSDEGKILDLNGKIENYNQYVLNLISCLLEKRYSNYDWHENLKWIVPLSLRTVKEKYIPALVCSRREGGYTFLRSEDRKVLIGIDHASLGYGTIAAHGHADALSFQMIVDGKKVFVDSGTYNYHFKPEDRDLYRRTKAHNTVMIDCEEQSEILGPFIWGRRAESCLVDLTCKENTYSIITKCTVSGRVHIRRFMFNGINTLMIEDEIGNHYGEAMLHIYPDMKIERYKNRYSIEDERIKISIDISNSDHKLFKSYYSKRYCSQEESIAILEHFEKKNIIKICIEGR